MANYEILRGDNHGRFLPKESLTRAQATVIIENVSEFLKKENSLKNQNFAAVDRFITSWTNVNIKNTMNEEEKTRKIHDFIAEKARYNIEALKSGRNKDNFGYSIYEPESIIFGEGGACDAYAKLFELMARKAGLNAKYVTGITLSTKGQSSHAWNMVKIDGTWYHIDTIWDDPIGREDILHLFYLRGDEFMKDKRIWYKDGNPPAYSDYNTDRTAIIDGIKTPEENVGFKDGMIIFY